MLRYDTGPQSYGPSGQVRGSFSSGNPEVDPSVTPYGCRRLPRFVRPPSMNPRQGSLNSVKNGKGRPLGTNFGGFLGVREFLRLVSTNQPFVIGLIGPPLAMGAHGACWGLRGGGPSYDLKRVLVKSCKVADIGSVVNCGPDGSAAY